MQVCKTYFIHFSFTIVKTIGCIYLTHIDIIKLICVMNKTSAVSGSFPERFLLKQSVNYDLNKVDEFSSQFKMRLKRKVTKFSRNKIPIYLEEQKGQCEAQLQAKVFKNCRN